MQEPDDLPSDASAQPAEPAAERPKRTRRKVVAETAEQPQAEAGEVSAAEPAPKPARKTAARKTASRKKAELPVEDAAASPALEPAIEPSVEQAPAAPVVAVIAEEPAPHGVFQLVDAPVDAVLPAVASGAAPDGETTDAPRRDRPARDGRRDGRRDGPRQDRQARSPRSQEASTAEGLDGQSPEFASPDADADADRPSRRAVMMAEQASAVFAELLSGDFDQQYQEEAAEAESGSESTKRVLRPEPDAPKLQKVLAQSGVGSRRDIESMIEEGRISVNDQVAHIGQRISYGDRIAVDGKPIRVRIQPPPARILAYHKPVGEVVTHDDPQDRPTVFRHLPRLQHGKWLSVGRLDLNTEGLLLFTNSGDLANQLMHPRFGVEREYAVRVLGSLTPDSKAQLLQGVEIEGQSAAFKRIDEGGGEGANRWYRVVITEGRNREVRKLFEAVGLTVSRLIRVRYGAIVLPHGLKRGTWVELGESDVRAVKALAGGDRQDGQRRQDDDRQGRRGRNGQGHQGNQGKPGGKDRFAQGQGQGPGQGGRPNQRPQHGQDRPPRQQQGQDRQPTSHDEDDNFGPIPNPLEQTFDRRFAKGSKRITAGFGRPDQQSQGPRGNKGGPREPDPLQTSVGYIGADAFFGSKGGGGGGGGGGGRGGKGGRRR